MKKFFSQAAEFWVIAILYIATAKIGFLLAIPPGNVTILWPPSGIALAAVLLLGFRAGFGIWFGSFAANSLFFQSLAPVSSTAILTSSGIAAGSTLQAFLGAYLIQRFIGLAGLPEQIKNIFKFIGIEVVCCLVAATFGVTSLYLAGFAPGGAFAYTWWTWWMGDFSGVLIVTPWLLIGANPDFRKRFAELAGFPTLGSGFGLSFILFFIIWNLENRQNTSPWILLIMGLLLSSLWVVYFELRRKTEKKLERQVLEQTQELKNQRVELIQSAKMAMVGQLASGVAHEINNPLQAISGNLDNIELFLKEEESLKKELPNIIWEMKIAVDRCQQIVKGLLHFAKPATAYKEKVHLEETIQEALMLTHPELDKEHVLIEKNLPSKIPIVQGNHRELMQVFINFITNAVRAMSDSDKKTLRIKAQVEGGKIWVSFQDTGCGIPENILPKIFEPFFTTSYEMAKGKMKGTGLGLSICQRIIEEHHGKIEVKSEVQKGSTFTVILPC